MTDEYLLAEIRRCVVEIQYIDKELAKLDEVPAFDPRENRLKLAQLSALNRIYGFALRMVGNCSD